MTDQPTTPCDLEGLERLRRFSLQLQYPNDPAAAARLSYGRSEGGHTEAHSIHLDIEAVLSRVARQAAALRECKATFLRYEQLHLEKRTADGKAKAKANAAMADMIDAALKAAGTSAPGHGGIAATEPETQQDPLIPVLAASLQEVSDMFFARPDMVKAIHPLMGPAEHAICARASSALRLARGEG